MKINKLAPFGVEVIGLEDLSQATAAEIRQIVAAMQSDDGCGVLVVRDQDLPPVKLQEALFKFSPAFGTPVKYDRWAGQSPGVEKCPYLALLGNYRAREPNDLGVPCLKGEMIAEFKPAQNVVEEWHTDGSFLLSPKSAICLYAPRTLEKALPPVGAATRFASCVRFYEQLDAAERSALDGLASVHSWEVFMRFLEARDPKREKVTPADIAKKPDVTWPLIRTHPETGRRMLYINPKNTRSVVRLEPNWPAPVSDPTKLPELPDGLHVEPESDAFVKELGARVLATGEYHHAWRRGDFVLWDNRQLLHAASPFDAERYERLLFRAEFSGEPFLHCPLDAFPRPLAAPPADHPLQTSCDYYLPCNAASVAWGYIDPNRPVQLIVADGATVAVDTITSGGPMCMPCETSDAVAGPAWCSPPEMAQIHERVVPDRIGVHILTGPVHVRGARPGDVLQIDILEVALRANWAWTISRPYGGALELGAPPHLRHTRLDGERGVARPPWGGELDLRPFFGVLATAPPVAFGRQSSIPPRNEFGGNLDCKELVAGTTLYLPVHVEGAQFVCGDGHARQGDGECCGTALETSLSGAFRLSIVRSRSSPLAHASSPSAAAAAACSTGPSKTPGARMGVLAPLARPRAESDTALITLACAMRVDEAAKLALEDMLDWLGELRPALERRDAYILLSAAADVRVTQLVNGVSRGAHVVLEKRMLPPPMALAKGGEGASTSGRDDRSASGKRMRAE